MIVEQNENKIEVQRILNMILVESQLYGFSYTKDFYSLYFGLMPNRIFREYKFPTEIALTIASKWLIGNAQEWNTKVERMRKNDLLEPVEPVIAYELTSLLWCKKYGGSIEKVLCNNDSIKINLKGNREFTILNQPEFEMSWAFHESGKTWYTSKWFLGWSNKYSFHLPI